MDAIRAIASLTIVWNHCFTANQNLGIENPTLAGIISFPSVYLGKFVLLFFVISGGVHYFLLNGRFSPDVQKGFLKRNLARLYIPAFAALMLSTALYFASYAWKGEGSVPNLREFVSNVFFVAHFTGENWTNVVLWNISIQLQHIFWVALVVIPLLRFRNGPAIAGICLLAVSIATTLLYPDKREDFLFYYPFFFLGYVLYEVVANDRKWLLIPAVVAIIWINIYRDYMSGVVALVPLALLLVNDWSVFKNKVVRWFGGISFSLYLVHVPIGKRVINLGASWADNDTQAWIVYGTALVAIFITAITFHRWVEVPCTRLARRIFS